jgi:transposase
MRKIRDVLRLIYECKMSQRKVHESLKVSRNTIADYISRAQLAGIGWPLPDGLDDLALEQLLFPVVVSPAMLHKPEPDWSEIHLALKQKGATLQALHEEYLVQWPNGISYSSFCRQHRAFKKSLKSSLRQAHTAGEKVFVDYAGPTVPIRNMQTGESKQAQIFVGVLGASNYIYVEAVWNQQRENWIASHVRMFEHFGGVPVMVVCDNLKSAVIKASRTDPVIHPIYLDMAAHYGTAIFPARAYKPKDKAKAEGGVLIIERWILFRIRKHIFTSLNELNATIKALLIDVNNRPFKKLPGSRISAFKALDQPALQPLVSQPYEFREFRKVRSGMDYHVEINNHYYSVPHALKRKELEAILTAGTIEILHRGQRVASHARSYELGKTTDVLHMESAHRHFAAWDMEQDLDWALSVGANTHAFLQIVLSNAPHRDFSYRSATSIKSLSREYGDERLEAGCKRALEIGAIEVRNVRSILKSNLDRQTGNQTIVQEATFEHDNIRGPDYYH